MVSMGNQRYSPKIPLVVFAALALALIRMPVDLAQPQTFQSPVEILAGNWGFEGGETQDYIELRPDGVYTPTLGVVIRVPAEWVAWARVGFPCDSGDGGETQQPGEMEVITKNSDPARVAEGEQAWQAFTMSGCHDMGLLREVATEPGQRYRFTAYGHAWYSDCDEPHEPPLEHDCETPIDWSKLTLRVGIDPTGGSDPAAETVVWSEPREVYGYYDRQLHVEAEAEQETVTVFLRSTAFHPLKHADAYWDGTSFFPEYVVYAPLVSSKKADLVYLPLVLKGRLRKKGAKLGPHLLRAASGTTEYLQSPIPVAKFCGSWGDATLLQKHTLAIGRGTLPYDAQWQYYAGFSPRAAAETLVADQELLYESNPRIEYWEGHNEPVWESAEEMAWYAQLEIERMKLLDERGLHAVIGNFSTGSPPLTQWEAFVPAAKAGKKYKAILGLHEYSCPWMWWLYGSYQPGYGTLAEDEGWLTLRYRKVYRDYLIPNDAVIPLVITETGIDPLVGPKPDSPPNVDCTGTWRQLHGCWQYFSDRLPGPVPYSEDDEEYYYRQLVWYDGELRKDYYVIGATLFTWGSTDQWGSFDVAGTDVAWKLIDYAQQNPAPPFNWYDYVR